MLTHESFHPLFPDDAFVMLEKCMNGTYFLHKRILPVHGAAM